MATLLELDVPMKSFELGQATGSLPGSHIELEQVVPLDDGAIPYFWAEAADFDAFEASVTEYDTVEGLELVAAVDGRHLYRIYWKTRGGFVRALSESKATVLEGSGSDPWRFRLLFPARSHVTAFRDRCSEAGVTFEVVRLSRVNERTGQREFDLTEEQHEALRLAIEYGYYAIPREISTASLASKIGISQQAMSERLRRGTAKVLTAAVDTGSHSSN
ncbi:Predicted DNA binding protein, contains HTH domain [Halogranum gelatinilyticum]|uniref:Predicted DNA binding protein, contains HTH domain n=1 Tax=Halogranum gelatinilyticum TaxID=660521 RepID=A0A1G9UG63_9EURY|nr:helix-turn-helix domain-containing protein [Halogranum gelatinilyticum]SDM58754.1 Predicted DNA binding protein, contains HTH domain [Halogranum gelatinilyticum]